MGSPTNIFLKVFVLVGKMCMNMLRQYFNLIYSDQDNKLFIFHSEMIFILNSLSCDLTSCIALKTIKTSV